MLPVFKNEPLTDFEQPENRKAFEQALQTVHSQFGKLYPLEIGTKFADGANDKIDQSGEYR